MNNKAQKPYQLSYKECIGKCPDKDENIVRELVDSVNSGITEMYKAGEWEIGPSEEDCAWMFFGVSIIGHKENK